MLLLLFQCLFAGGCDRVLRPMILTKQLDLPQSMNDYSFVSPATPRTNLAKELDKYNRPPVDHQFGKPIAPKPKECQPPKPPTPAVSSAPERPNILSKRPHYKPQYRYDPGGPMNLSTKLKCENSPDMAHETLDLSIKKEGQQRPTVLVTPQSAAHMQEEPMDFSTKSISSPSSGTYMSPISSPVSSHLGLHSPPPVTTNNNSYINITPVSIPTPASITTPISIPTPTYTTLVSTSQQHQPHTQQHQSQQQQQTQQHQPPQQQHQPNDAMHMPTATQPGKQHFGVAIWNMVPTGP